MNTYYQNSHTKNPLLTDRQKAQNEKNARELALNVERIKMKMQPFQNDLDELNKELKEKKQYISTSQLRVHRKRARRLRDNIEACKIEIDKLNNNNL